jgi:hypothetical protein
LHNARKELVSERWRSKRWIVCELVYKDWRREVMAAGKWTELFFLDEATALAAGHRPCKFCRRRAYEEYQERAGVRMRADELDAMLHAERTAERPVVDWDALPDGAMLDCDGAVLRWRGRAWAWSHWGYQQREAPVRGRLLTPGMSVRALRGGYAPVVHGSVGE